MPKTAFSTRLGTVLDEVQTVHLMGACMLEGCRTGSAYFGLCPAHYAEAVSGRIPPPPQPSSADKCAIRWDTNPPLRGEPYCREHRDLLASMKGGALAQAVDEKTEFPALDLPVAEVHPGWPAMRPDLSAEDVHGLAASIGTDGQHHPILVVPDKEHGAYLIVDGFRRWMAVSQIPGKKTIWARVMPAGTPESEIVRIASAANFQRQWIAPFAKSAWIYKLRKERGLETPQIAAAMGLTDREVQYHLAVMERAEPRVLRAYSTGRIGLATAIDLARLPLRRQSTVLDQILSGKLERAEQRTVARRAVDAEIRAAFAAFKSSPYPGYSVSGGKRGPRTACCLLTGEEEFFLWFKTWVWPREKRRRRK